MGAAPTVGMAEAKANFGKLASDANRTGMPFVVFRNNRPWADVRPLACGASPVPAETAAAMEEADAMSADQGHERFETAESFFAALGL